MIAVGIDPGASGAVAWIGGDIRAAFVFKNTESDIAGIFRFLGEVKEPSGIFALIEKVSAMPGQGVSSTFKFGQSYGFLRGLLIANGIPFETVAAGKWQREFRLIRRGKYETTTEKKNRHKARAQELFPGVRQTHATADAFLIAEYCRRVKCERGAA